jgi:hypothetical protein
MRLEVNSAAGAREAVGAPLALPHLRQAVQSSMAGVIAAIDELHAALRIRVRLQETDQRGAGRATGAHPLLVDLARLRKAIHHRRQASIESLNRACLEAGESAASLAQLATRFDEISRPLHAAVLALTRIHTQVSECVKREPAPPASLDPRLAERVQRLVDAVERTRVEHDNHAIGLYRLHVAVHSLLLVAGVDSAGAGDLELRVQALVEEAMALGVQYSELRELLTDASSDLGAPVVKGNSRAPAPATPQEPLHTFHTTGPCDEQHPLPAGEAGASDDVTEMISAVGGFVDSLEKRDAPDSLASAKRTEPVLSELKAVLETREQPAVHRRGLPGESIPADREDLAGDDDRQHSTAPRPVNRGPFVGASLLRGLAQSSELAASIRSLHQPAGEEMFHD